jgi:hypothetical protein
MPHAPQFCASFDVFTSQPFATCPSQLPKPALHGPTPHAPAEHTGVAFGVTQAFPQLPQLCTLDVMFTSQPFATTASQSPNPASHAAMPHTAAEHIGVAFGVTQTFPQAPQL